MVYIGCSHRFKGTSLHAEHQTPWSQFIGFITQSIALAKSFHAADLSQDQPADLQLDSFLVIGRNSLEVILHNQHIDSGNHTYLSAFTFTPLDRSINFNPPSCFTNHEDYQAESHTEKKVT